MQAGLFTLSGVIVGSVLTFFFARSNQHNQWVRDNRMREFRELLSAIAKSMDAHLRNWQELRPQSPEEQQELNMAVAECSRTFYDRILVSKEVGQHRLKEIWISATDSYKNTFNEKSLLDAYETISFIVRIAAYQRPKRNYSLRSRFNYWRKTREELKRSHPSGKD